MADPSYAQSCSGQATAYVTLPECGNAPPASPYAQHQYLQLQAVSGVDNSIIPASECTASYLDYQVYVQLRSTEAWTEWSGRAYGVVNESGRCALAYSGQTLDDYGPENLMAAEISADSYLVISGPSFHDVIPQSVRFNFDITNQVP